MPVWEALFLAVMCALVCLAGVLVILLVSA
jgi:hypothetical protein